METRKIPGRPRYSLTPNAILFRDGKEVEIFVGKNGYRQAWIYRGKKRLRHPKLLYKLMAATYLGRRPSKKHLVRHLDGDCHNDAAANLAWGTHYDNMQDLKKHRESRASLTNALKAVIIKAVKKTKTVEDRKALAAKHNVSFLTVNNYYWKWKDGKL